MKKLKLWGILLLGLIMIPLTVKADSYNTLDFEQTLADEEIEPAFEKYKPSSDAITIYLFRGKGCGYCHRYLEFMNSITDEYGKYFKMESYEVWNDANNAALMSEVSTYLGEEAGGVPYIVIGDKVFGGYSDQYDAEIKQAIVDLYNTKAKKRYDVFEEMKKHPNKKNTGSGNNNSVIWSLVFTFVSTVIIMSYIKMQAKEIKAELNKNKHHNYYDNKPNKAKKQPVPKTKPKNQTNKK